MKTELTRRSFLKSLAAMGVCAATGGALIKALDSVGGENLASLMDKARGRYPDLTPIEVDKATYDRVLAELNPVLRFRYNNIAREHFLLQGIPIAVA